MSTGVNRCKRVDKKFIPAYIKINQRDGVLMFSKIRQSIVDIVIARLKSGEVLTSREHVKNSPMCKIIGDVEKAGYKIKRVQVRPKKLSSDWRLHSADRYTKYTLRGDK